ncbi:hypothetical protein V6N12_034807 [Hibiscus sabdariffa]|uniref:NB-ARC domain-containing protein n=1 Tax=Hibiscus sabdariffa TaxID=183260 RepID=A0ABR2B8U3_9ROSI
MQCFVSFSFSSSSTHPFQSLERLHLSDLPNLREIIKVERDGSAAISILALSATFSCLKVIILKGCSSMETLLPNLQNLEEIWVKHCQQLIEILGAPTLEDEENERDALIKFSLPKLRELRLDKLPELKSICSKNGVLVCDSLRTIVVNKCCKLRRIPPFVSLVGNGLPYAYAPPSLQILSRTQSWWESLEWDDPSLKNEILHKLATTSPVARDKSMEYVEPAVSIANCLGTPVCKYLQYHRKLNDYVRNLKRIRDELNSKAEDIELQLKSELLHPLGKIPKKEVQNWLDKAKTMIGEAQGVENKVSNGRYLCRACNGKLVDEKTREMQTFLDKAPNASDSLVIDGPSVGLPLATSELVGGKAVREEIWQCLMQEEVSMIGVWGMGGVGKTTIMKHIHNDLLKQSRFDKVIWATISKEFNVTKLQDDIASALNLKNDLAQEENKVRRAAIMLEMLKKAGKYVLILDDVWDKFCSEEVGIPEPSSSNGCKMVLTTRSKQVCNRMGCRDIPVALLSEEEALILFLNKDGPNIVQSQTLMPILRLVVNECARLPLTVVVFAGTLKGEDDPRIWNIALKEMKDRIGMVEGVDAEVIECLKFSFDHLKDEKVKCCFLYCSLYPEDFEIEKDELVQCWMDEGFIDEVDTRQDMEDMGHAIVKKLVDNCLLENVIDRYGHPCVKMHDALRDMALSITSMNHRYMIKAALQLEKLPKEVWRAEIEKVSLMWNSISEISEDMSPPNCQRLTTLLLQRNPIKKIPNAFFANVPHLSVLNLSFTDIESLPDSISELKHLTTLLLSHCGRLRRVPCLSKLQGLKKLDLCHTYIEEVPDGMDKLVNLRYLNLQGHSLKYIPAGLLSKLSSLQHLKLTIFKLKASLEEVMTLEKLECFEGYFRDMPKLNKFVSYMQQSKKNLIKYRFEVGIDPSNFYSDGVDKSVIISRYKSCEDDLIMLPFDVQGVSISEWHHLRSLNDIPSLENVKGLTNCRIMSCEEMDCVASFTSASSSTHPFQSLEQLYLSDLPKLREVIKVERLRSETSILAPSATFFHLKFLRIEILGAPTSGDEENGSDALIKFSLPKLRELTLMLLPQLEKICTKNGVMVCDSLRLIEVHFCSKLKRIPPFVPLVGNGQPYAYAPSSLRIESSTKWWELLQWDDPNFKNVLQPHFKK